MPPPPDGIKWGLTPDMMASLAAGRAGEPVNGQRRVRSDAMANRERIMHAAARLFRERGVDVPLDEVAAASGLGSATLHRHFQGRVDLVHAVLDAEAARVAAGAGRLLSEHGPDQALRTWLSDLIRFSMSYRGLAVLLAAHDADTTIRTRHETLAQACRQLLTAARDGGPFAPPSTPARCSGSRTGWPSPRRAQRAWPATWPMSSWTACWPAHDGCPAGATCGSWLRLISTQASRHRCPPPCTPGPARPGAHRRQQVTAGSPAARSPGHAAAGR